MFQTPFDVSGVHGAPGPSGVDLGSTTAPIGNNGRRGGHGTQGYGGTPAGTISMRLATPISTADIPENVILANPNDADVKLKASIVYTTGQQHDMDTILKINSDESMSLLARGGNGGRGGDGGSGQNGGTGVRYGAFFIVLSFNESNF